MVINSLYRRSLALPFHQGCSAFQSYCCPYPILLSQNIRLNHRTNHSLAIYAKDKAIKLMSIIWVIKKTKQFLIEDKIRTTFVINSLKRVSLLFWAFLATKKMLEGICHSLRFIISIFASRWTYPN